MNGIIKVCHQTLVTSWFKYFESSSLFCNNCHSLYFSSIVVTVVVMVRAMGRDFSGSLSVDFHSIHVYSYQQAIVPIINRFYNKPCLAVPS